MQRRVISKLTTAALAVTVTATALAGEGRRPVFTKSTVLNQGHVILTRNISGSGPVIEVGADDVTIDLNNFVVEETGGGPAIFLDGFNNVTIRNGTVLGGSEGINIRNARNVRLENLEVIGATGAGILLFGTSDFEIRGSTITNTGGQGILIDAAASPLPVQGTIAQNILDATSLSSIEVLGGVNVTVVDNRVLNSNADGIRLIDCSGLLVADNTIRDAIIGGIRVIDTRATRVEGNMVTIADEGIFVSDASEHNSISRNIVTDIDGPGILVDGNGNHITNNTLGSNNQCGMWLSSSSIENVYRGNTAKGNSGCLAACTVGTVSTGDFCDDGAAGSNDSPGNNFMPFAL